MVNLSINLNFLSKNLSINFRKKTEKGQTINQKRDGSVRAKLGFTNVHFKSI
jgi:hypothetical protein